MGDPGIALLYAKRDWPASLPLAQFRYRQLKNLAFSLMPSDAWKLTPFASESAIGVALGLTNSAIVSLQVSLQYLFDIGVENIAEYRSSLIDHLGEELTAMGYDPLTPRTGNSPIVCFEVRNPSALRPLLSDAQIAIKLHNDRIRVSPSVFNTKGDIELLIEVLHRTK
jgi:selenocysteine lyase/cysteine desulfurase